MGAFVRREVFSSLFFFQIKQRTKITRQQRIERTRRSKRDENARVTRHRHNTKEKGCRFGQRRARACVFVNVNTFSAGRRVNVILDHARGEKKKKKKKKKKGGEAARRKIRSWINVGLPRDDW